jgi:hypothetical protein
MEENLNIYELIGTSAIFSVILISLLIFLFKTVIKEFFTNAIKYDYNIKLEKLKAEISQNESDIKNLREGALASINYRQNIIYSKKNETAEKLWNDIIDLSKAKFYPQILSQFDIKKTSLKAKEDEKVQDYFKSLEGKFNIEDFNFVESNKYQLFLPQTTWAYFKAYRAIIINSTIIFSSLKIGLEVNEIINEHGLKDLLIIVLPERKDEIAKINTPNTFYYLLEILENKILYDLQNIVKGLDNDFEHIQSSFKIIQDTNNLNILNNKTIIDKINNL